jgi:hypothetical protein
MHNALPRGRACEAGEAGEESFSHSASFVEYMLAVEHSEPTDER